MGAICRAGASFLSSSFPVLKKRISTIAKIALIVLTLFSSFPKNLAAAGGENRPSPHLPDCWNSVTDYFQNEGCIVSIKRSSNTFLENQQDPALARAIKKRIKQAPVERSGNTVFVEFNRDDPIVKAAMRKSYYARQEQILSKSPVYRDFMRRDAEKILREGLDIVLLEDRRGNGKLLTVSQQKMNEVLEEAHLAASRRAPLPLSYFFESLTCDQDSRNEL